MGEITIEPGRAPISSEVLDLLAEEVRAQVGDEHQVRVVPGTEDRTMALVLPWVDIAIHVGGTVAAAAQRSTGPVASRKFLAEPPSGCQSKSDIPRPSLY